MENLATWTTCQRSLTDKQLLQWGQLHQKAQLCVCWEWTLLHIGSSPNAGAQLPKCQWIELAMITLSYDIREKKACLGTDSSKIMGKGYEASSKHNPGIQGLTLRTRALAIKCSCPSKCLNQDMPLGGRRIPLSLFTLYLEFNLYPDKGALGEDS